MFKILKRILILVVILLLTLLGVYFTDRKYRFLPMQQREVLDKLVDSSLGIKPQNIQELVSGSEVELSTLKDRGAELSEHSQKVLGAAIEPAEDQKPLHDRAFEYGRYIYCKEVVKTYEEINP